MSSSQRGGMYIPDLSNETITLETQQDLVQYICNNPAEHITFTIFFNKFRDSAILHPLVIIKLIPTNQGVEAFKSILLAFYSLLEEGLLDKNKVKDTEWIDLVLLCGYGGFEILLDYIVPIFQLNEFSANRICGYLYSAMLQMSQNGVPEYQMVKISEIITTLNWDFTDVQYHFQPSHDSLYKLVQLLGLYNQFELIWNIIQLLLQEIDKTEDSQTKAKWFERISVLIKHVHVNKKDDVKEAFLMRIIQSGIWNGVPLFFEKLFNNASRRSVEIIMTHCNMLETPLTSYTANDSMIRREMALLEFATGSVIHNSKVKTRLMYTEIINRAEQYLKNGIAMDLIILLLSYEFSMYYSAYHKLMETFLTALVKRIITNNADFETYRMMYKPTPYNEKQWRNVAGTKWKLVKYSTRSNLGNTDSNPVFIAIDTLDPDMINYACKMIHLYTPENEIYFNNDLNVLKRLSEKKTDIQIAPKYQDTFMYNPMNAKYNQGCIVMERMNYNLKQFLFLKSRSSCTLRDSVTDIKLKKIIEQIQLKAEALLKAGVFHENVTLENIVVKGGLNSEKFEIFFIDFGSFHEFDVASEESSIRTVANSMTRSVTKKLNKWIRMLQTTNNEL